MLNVLPPRAPGSEVTLDGYLVPRVEVREEATTGQWSLTYDGRFGVMADSLEELQRWLWIVANAQAVGEGYSCHGEHSAAFNRHKVKAMCIGSVGKATDTPAG